MTTLRDEVTTDPLGRGYAGMTDQQLVDDLNAPVRTRERTTMSAGEIMEHIDTAEFAALTNANKARVDRVLGLGADVIIGPRHAHSAVQEFLATFGGGSATLTALTASRDEVISRATEIGVGTVTHHTLKMESLR